MKVLGVRTSASCVRYAIVDHDGEKFQFSNAGGENRLRFPADSKNVGEKLHWLYQEFERIFRNYPQISSIALKPNEYRGAETTTSREAAYLDAVVLMFGAKNGIGVTSTLYRSLGTRRDEVKQVAEEAVGRLDQHWDEQIADAIVAAMNAILKS